MMSAALVGILIGAIVGGMLADRIGRRIIILSAAAGFGILSLLTARAASMDAPILLRFLTGLGLWAVLPNLVAMSNEYSPRRLKALTVVLVFAGGLEPAHQVVRDSSCCWEISYGRSVAHVCMVVVYLDAPR
jgi:MFS family permease